MDRTNENAMIG